MNSARAELLKLGPCSACGQSSSRRLYDVVSSNFLNLDMLRGRGSALLCDDCAEMFGSKTLRLFPYRWPEAIQLTPADLLGLLSQPLPSTIGVSVPVLGRKHIAPFWLGGCVVTDGGLLLWGPAEAARMADVARAKALGVGETAILQNSPPWIVVRDLQPDQVADLISIWGHLDAWRRQTPYMLVALRALRRGRQVPTGGEDDE